MTAAAKCRVSTVEQVVHACPASGAADVGLAVAAARRAADEGHELWGGLSATERVPPRWRWCSDSGSGGSSRLLAHSPLPLVLSNATKRPRLLRSAIC